ncbi:MAG: HAD family hydrolase [Clostridiales bacterium]|jgi:FMN phosphatase YigB (HAD superfamily)|nr:HAD family hydrolase [Clostridiales bacterium]
MAYKAMIFDLDGTLLPMDHMRFGTMYFESVRALFDGDPRVDGGRLFMDGLKAGIIAMKKNDGSQTNRAAYHRAFVEKTGYDGAYVEDKMERYYLSAFKALKISTHPDPNIAAAVRLLKEAGIKLALATDPLFPLSAVVERIGWADLKPSDFLHIPTYDKHRFSKPAPGFFGEVLSYIDAAPADTLMVGNSVYNDMPSARAGIDCYMLDDCLLNEKNEDIVCKYRSDIQGFYRFVEELTEGRRK